MKKNNVLKLIFLLLISVSAVILYFTFSHKDFSENSKKSSNPAKRKEIVLVYRLPATHPYWSIYINIMKIASNNLGMDFESYSANWNFMKMVKIVQSLASNNKQVAAIALDNVSTEKGAKLMHLIDDKKIPVLLVNAKYYPKDFEDYKLNECKYLIGQIYADNFEAGYILAKELAEHAPVSNDGYIYMLAFSGHEITSVSIERVNGLKKAVRENKKIKLVKVVPAEWNREIAKERFVFYKTVVNPKITAVWGGNDDMAIGAIEGAESLGLKPGKDILFTGINWSEEGLKKVKEGKLLGSMGGHFFEAAWASVIIYDYLNGIRFPEKEKEWTIKMHYIDKNNIQKYKKLLDKNNWNKLNFKVFSKTNNPNQKKYNFDLIKLIDQLK